MWEESNHLSILLKNEAAPQRTVLFFHIRRRRVLFFSALAVMGESGTENLYNVQIRNEGNKLCQ